MNDQEDDREIDWREALLVVGAYLLVATVILIVAAALLWILLGFLL